MQAECSWQNYNKLDYNSLSEHIFQILYKSFWWMLQSSQFFASHFEPMDSKLWIKASLAVVMYWEQSYQH